MRDLELAVAVVLFGKQLPHARHALAVATPRREIHHEGTLLFCFDWCCTIAKTLTSLTKIQRQREKEKETHTYRGSIQGFEKVALAEHNRLDAMGVHHCDGDGDGQND